MQSEVFELCTDASMLKERGVTFIGSCVEGPMPPNWVKDYQVKNSGNLFSKVALT